MMIGQKVGDKRKVTIVSCDVIVCSFSFWTLGYYSYPPDQDGKVNSPKESVDIACASARLFSSEPMVGLNTRQDKLGIAARHAESLGGIPRMPFGVAPA
jgi:hypothetical protein